MMTGGLVGDGASETLEACNLALAFIQNAVGALAHGGTGLTLEGEAGEGVHVLIGAVREALMTVSDAVRESTM